jgi:hypothetical protein
MARGVSEGGATQPGLVGSYLVMRRANSMPMKGKRREKSFPARVMSCSGGTDAEAVKLDFMNLSGPEVGAFAGDGCR